MCFREKCKFLFLFFFRKKSKIFIFLTFYMYGLSQIFVRFALRGLVSEKNAIFFFFFAKKVKFSFF